MIRNLKLVLVVSGILIGFYTSSAQKVELKQQMLNMFQCLISADPEARYTVSLCADVPDNNDPERLYVGQETGHVFITFSRNDFNCSISFGFYPRKPVQSLFFKKVKSRILQNPCREYDVSISQDISAEVLTLLMDKAIQLSDKKYDIKRYNCYDYALDIFNAIPGIQVLARNKSKFPFILGKGGSPCTLYQDLKRIKDHSPSIPNIHFGSFESPSICVNNPITENQYKDQINSLKK